MINELIQQVFFSFLIHSVGVVITAGKELQILGSEEMDDIFNR
jgi:hypothetical protein